MPQEDELLTWQKDVCKGLGLPWPPPKAKAGKPNRQALWLRAIYAELRAGRTLPDGVTAAVPVAWLSGDSLESTGVSDAEVGAAGELAKCEAVAKKRRRTTIDPDVKDWFLDYHECMKVKHKRNMRQSWRLSLLGNVNEATYYRWTHSDCMLPDSGSSIMRISPCSVTCAATGQSNFRHKLAWTMKQHDVSPARVINADETCVRLLPANSYGWSRVGGKASQLCSSKAAITGTLAVPWMPRLHCICSSFSRARRTRVCRIETILPTRSAGALSVRHPNTL